MNMKAHKICIIGAGVIGLSTGVRLQEILGTQCHVTIISEKFGRDTTSNGAAGLFRPTLDLVNGVPEVVVRRWVDASWKQFEKIAKSTESKDAGVYFLSGYHMYKDGEGYVKSPNLMKERAYNYRDMTDSEHALFGCTRRKNGVFYTSIMIEGEWYLPWLQNKFEKNGGTIKKRFISSFYELLGHYDIIVNCTGLGARELCDDSKVVPNRGQVLRIEAPWLKHFVYVDHHCWIIPGINTVTVGGTRQHGNEDQTVNEKDAKDVFQRACEAIPSLKKAKILKVWPGLRPHRSPPRIEKEIIRNSIGQQVILVHHYGHGGNGMGLSWGTACDAADIVKQAVNSSLFTSKL